MSRVPPLKESPFFYSSTLLFSDATMEMLNSSVVGVAGVGGVGAVATEMLARSGIGNLKIADLDTYEERNLNRQLFATQETLGRNKAVCAAERVRSINPDCNVEVFEQGIVLETIEAFCSGVDVLVCQADRESSKTLLYRAAKRFRIPVVTGSRASIHDHRWKVRAKVYNYRDNPDLECYDEIFHPDMTAVPFGELTEEILRKYDEKVRTKDRSVFKTIALEKPGYFGSIDPESLRERIETTENYNKRHVCAVQANTGGCLVATQALKVLLGGPSGDIEINLWEG